MRDQLMTQYVNSPEYQQNLEQIEQEISTLEESYFVTYKSIRQYLY